MNQQSTARPNITVHPREPAQKHTAPGRKFVRRASLLTAAAITCALTACTSNPNNPTTSPTPTASPTLVRPDTSEYPGIVFTGPPMTPEQAKIVDAVAKRSYVYRSMFEKEPKSYAPLKEVATEDEAADMELTLRDSHKNNYVSKGWARYNNVMVSSGSSTASVTACLDESDWSRVNDEYELRSLRLTKTTISLVSDGKTWLVSEVAFKKDLTPAEIKECS